MISPSFGPPHYVGRFAPSPTGPLHAGSLVAALASWLDARAHGGAWLVRIEDVDAPRCTPGAAEHLLMQLAACGLVPDAPPAWQSARGALYEAALRRLNACGWAYACGCTRADIAAALAAKAVPRERHAELAYSGTCRHGLDGKPARAMRLRVAPTLAAPDTDLHLAWHDRRLGAQRQNVTQAVGDFVLRRADGCWAYQLAVVVDDAAQGITHVVRGEDLADNTPRQIHLQRVLGLRTPTYLHTPLVLAADGAKLSKQHGAPPVDVREPLAALQQAARALGLHGGATDAPDPPDVAAWLAAAVLRWRDAHPPCHNPVAPV